MIPEQTMCQRRLEAVIKPPVVLALSRETQLDTSADIVLGAALSATVGMMAGTIEAYLPDTEPERSEALQFLHAELIIAINEMFKGLDRH